MRKSILASLCLLLSVCVGCGSQVKTETDPADANQPPEVAEEQPTEISGHYKAEESLFMNGDPRYPLIYAKECYRHYLDLDSCMIISDNEDGFEISADYIEPNNTWKPRTTCRFRKNEVSNRELQVLSDYSKDWQRIYNPYDEETIRQTLEEEGRVYYGLAAYYMFKCVYQQLFGKPYEDAFDDDELRRSVIILLSKEDIEKKAIPQYLWDDANYPRVWTQMDNAFYLDKSSIYIEMEDPPQYILRALILSTPMHHNHKDIMPLSISLERLLYDEEEEKMYAWWHRDEEWHYMPPHGSNAESGMGMRVGEAAFYLAYGEKFYGAAPKWHHFFKSYWDVFQDDFYERLEGEA